MSDRRHRLLARVTPPQDEPLTLAECKAYLRVEHSDDDAAIGAMLAAARDTAERYLRRSLMPQQWQVAYDDFLPREVPLPMGPVTGIDAVTLIALDGGETIIAATAYRLNAAKDMLLLDEVFFAAQVTVTYDTGYAEADSVPAAITQGMLAHLAEMYDAKNHGAALPETSRALYAPHREIRL